MNKRILTTEEGIAVIDGTMRSRAVTDEARTVWRHLRARLLQCEEVTRVVAKTNTKGEEG